MLLSSVTLVLQEMLEAALLISVMLMFSFLFNKLWRNSFFLTYHWIYFSITVGIVGAILLAYFTPTISVWFDYVGQEIVNTGIHLLSLIFLILLTYVVPAEPLNGRPGLRRRLIVICMASVVLLSIVREGEEIILYLQGFFAQSESFSTVFFGGLLGAGIGGSIGILLYYLLVNLRSQWSIRVGLVLLCLITGNTGSQMALLLNQADWMPYTPVLWNSASVIPETSILGRLLYAFIGYEATPSAAQVLSYVAGILLIVASPLCRTMWVSNLEVNTVTSGVMR